jgi:2-polyprenyl-6-methoxyphenol hydroxylase-like FAD-dependent oxidoreductase
MTTEANPDVVIIGAGLAGTAIAHCLARRGLDVALVDRQAKFPDVFRAEKIEPDQAAALRALDLLDMRSPHAATMGQTLSFDGRELKMFDTVEQYGFRYADTVNAMRASLPSRVRRQTGRVASISAGTTRREVQLEGGPTISAPLVVIATGGSPALAESLGMRRGPAHSLRSLSIGFDIAPVSGDRFAFHPHRGFDYFLPFSDDLVDYVTIFTIGDAMRVNVFTQWEPRDERVRSFMDDPVAAMERYFPGVTAHTGPFAVCSRPQAVPTEFYRLRRVDVPGVVVVGDEFQSVSPTTGTGLTKVLADIDVLCNHCAPRWFADRADPRVRIGEFYRHPAKVAADMDSFQRWVYYHHHCRGRKLRLLEKIELRARKLLNVV